uniref:RHD domain-containing protein n=1 Tax=Macrostomum lignano TaxID=282301 RepID=A0A1I8FLF3_9PLAT
INFSLEKVSLICVGKLGAKLAAAIRKRNELGFNPYGKNLQDVKYTSRNLNQLRLAFQLHFVDKDGALQASPHQFANAVTDVVSDINEDKSQYQVSLCIPDTDLSQPARIEKLQKHLLSIVTPDLRQTLIGSNFSCERLRGQLVVKDLRQRGPQSKRKRPAAADQNLNSAGDPAVWMLCAASG